MPLRKKIKTLIALFVVLILAFAVTAAVLFRKNFEHFNAYVQDRAKSHLEILKSLSQIEIGVYIHQKSLACALVKGDDKCATNMTIAKNGVMNGLKSLERFNQSHFSSWVTAESFSSPDVEKELRDTLISYKEASKNLQRNDTDFQRLYHLVRFSALRYFDSADERLKTAGRVLDEALLNADQERDQGKVDFLYLGIHAIKDYYNQLFWDNAEAQNSIFTRNTRNYYFAMIATSGLLLIFALIIAVLLDRHFRLQQQGDEKLIILGARDLATGLFNKRSLEALLGQEIHRAKRCNYTLSILMIRLEPYEQIRAELGQIALDRMFFQVSETLKTACRAYDSIFKLDKNSFLIVFPEANPNIINALATRFRKKLDKKRFLVKSDQTKVSPLILMGAAGYPLNGAEYNDLLAFAEMTLSEEFDARIIREQVDGVVQTPEPASPKFVESREQIPETATETRLDSAMTVPVQDIPEPPFQTQSDNDFTFVPPVAVAPASIPEVMPEANTPGDESSKTPAPEQFEKNVAKSDLTEAAPPPQAPANEISDDQDDGFTFVPPGTTSKFPATTAQPTPIKPVASNPEPEIPDVVSALLQDELQTELPMAPDVVTKILSLDNQIKTVSKAVPKRDTSVIRGVATGDDVIMVDFDRERENMAEGFRRKKNAPK